MARTDEEIAKDVADHLRWDNRLDASSLTVAVRHAVVYLGGEVSRYQDQSAAVESAWSVTGVRDVISDLSARSDRKTPLPADTDLLARIQTALEWSPQIEEDDLEPIVFEGTVTLEGSVNAHWKRRHVEDLISSIEGVVAIHNNLAVVPHESIQDHLIADDIVTALQRHALVDADRIEVKVENGEVTLSGRITSIIERKAAEETASNTAGVIAIHNHLLMEEAA